MEQALRDIGSELGLSPLATAIGVLAVLALAAVAGLVIRSRIEGRPDPRRTREQVAAEVAAGDEKRAHDALAAYAQEQGVAANAAYRRLYEPDAPLEGAAALRAVAEADEELMAPLRNYRPWLDAETEGEVLALHNELAQFRGDASEAAVRELLASGGRFYAQVDRLQRVLRPEVLRERRRRARGGSQGGDPALR